MQDLGGYDYNSRYMKQQMKLIRAGEIVYVHTCYIALLIEEKLELEQLDYTKTTICDNSVETSMYSFQLKKWRDIK